MLLCTSLLDVRCAVFTSLLDVRCVVFILLCEGVVSFDDVSSSYVRPQRLLDVAKFTNYGVKGELGRRRV